MPRSNRPRACVSIFAPCRWNRTDMSCPSPSASVWPSTGSDRKTGSSSFTGRIRPCTRQRTTAAISGRLRRGSKKLFDWEECFHEAYIETPNIVFQAGFNNQVSITFTVVVFGFIKFHPAFPHRKFESVDIDISYVIDRV